MWAQTWNVKGLTPYPKSTKTNVTPALKVNTLLPCTIYIPHPMYFSPLVRHISIVTLVKTPMPFWDILPMVD